MRTNIEINDELIADAMRTGGLTTKRETVDAALKTYVRLGAQREARTLRGTINWIGDLDAMRRD
jgi:Arc/MetJ family transcription regulator